MNRLLMNTILAFGSAFMCAAGLHAQSSYRLVAEVPFNFEAGGAMHKAGRYTVERPRNTEALILCSVKDTRRTFIGLAPSAVDFAKSRGQLSFHRYGNRSFLAEVRNVEQAGIKIHPSAQEKEIRKTALGSEVAVVNVPCTRGTGL